MKWWVAVLLLANIGLALWGYGWAPQPVAAPRPLHARRLQWVVPGAQPLALPLAPAPAATGLAAAPVAPVAPVAQRPPKARRPAPSARGRSSPPVVPKAAPAAAQTACWRLGPVLQRAQAVSLLRRLHLSGQVFSRLGPPAYRVFLPVGAPWPSAAVLVSDGVRGAYVTHGPTGAEVLSLGVFLKRAAALAEVRLLQSRHLAVRLAPFGAPTHYYDTVRLARVSVGFWRKLGPIGHAVCAQAR